MSRTTQLIGSFGATFIRMGAGVRTTPRESQPEQPIEIYEFEACPYCRKVREALTALDLNALFNPCPKGGTVFRPAVEAKGGKQQFPYMVDPNTGTEMYESDDIIDYLFETYGNGQKPSALSRGRMAFPTAMLASAFRPSGGVKVRKNKRPEEPLQLWSFEANPFARLVRENLCELELPFILHSSGRGDRREFLPPGVQKSRGMDYEPSSQNRKELKERAGKVMIPYLYDPNTDTGMFESADIVDYLNETYATE